MRQQAERKRLAIVCLLLCLGVVFLSLHSFQSLVILRLFSPVLTSLSSVLGVLPLSWEHPCHDTANPVLLLIDSLCGISADYEGWDIFEVSDSDEENALLNGAKHTHTLSCILTLTALYTCMPTPSRRCTPVPLFGMISALTVDGHSSPRIV